MLRRGTSPPRLLPQTTDTRVSLSRLGSVQPIDQLMTSIEHAGYCDENLVEGRVAESQATVMLEDEHHEQL